MNFLRYLEKAWIVAAACSFLMGIFNLIRLHSFDNRVYFPFFCAGFCLLIWFNVRGQRRFREKIFGEGQGKDTGDKDKS